MRTRPLLILLLAMAPLLAGGHGSCTVLEESAPDDADTNSDPAQPFLDGFNAGLIFWRLTTPIPREDLTAGNPLPSMEVGSVTGLATGGVTIRKFDISRGLVVEADVYWEPPSGATTAMPEAWVGLSDEDDPTGTPALAAGLRVDPAGTLHFQVNGADVGTTQAPAAGGWRRFSTAIRVDRVVEFRVDGVLLLTGGVVAAEHTVRPVEACGIGSPERPRFDNVAARLP